MKKIYLFLLPVLFLFAPLLAKASVCDQNTTLDFIARDPGGAYIPKANVTVYKQEVDANGAQKPTTQFASGSTDSVLGTVHLSWRNSAVGSDTYVIKVSTINNNNASFWYYNNTFTCGQSASLSKTLSGILFILHDLNGDLLTNTNFSVYSQIYSNGQALAQKKEQLTTLNSGTSGQVEAYLPQGSVRSLDGTYSDQYELEFSHNNNAFSYYGIKVLDGQLTTMNYYISSLKVKLQDITGAAYPANTNVEVYTQEVTASNDHQLGAKVGQFTLGSDGYGTFEVKAGMYVLGIKGSDNQYQYFWDMQVEDGRSAEYTVTTTTNQSSSNTSSGTCPNNSTLTLTLRNLSGDIAPGLHYELYEQKTDANGLPIAGNRINGGTIDNSGQAVLNFKPDPRLIYAIKVWDKNSNVGDYWFYDAIRFVCDSNRVVTKSIPALKVIIRDHSGALERNYNFSLYAEKFDVDNNPMFESSDLVANLKTDGGGSALVYVAPYNAYRRGQSGIYALTTKDASNNTVIAYNINVTGDKDYTFTYSIAAPGKAVDANLSKGSSSTPSSPSKPATTAPSATTPVVNNSVAAYKPSTALAGRILLQVEDKGQAWYVNPLNNKRYYLGRPNDAFNIMRKLGLGISNKNFDMLLSKVNKSLLGRILIKVEDSGRAYYYNPLNAKLYYLGRPDDAFRIIRSLGLGISNANLNKITIGN
jgi:hypothetical protein